MTDSSFLKRTRISRLPTNRTSKRDAESAQDDLPVLPAMDFAIVGANSGFV
jgi:hypothetical protein